MTDGYYSKLSQRIKEISDQEILVINVETLMDYIDISEMDEDRKNYIVKRAIATGALCQNKWRSVLKGSGYFVDLENIDNPIYIQKLCENANLDAHTKEAVAKALERLKRENIESLPEYAQYVFDFDAEGNSRYIEELTQAQLLEMLQKDAEAISK